MPLRARLRVRRDVPVHRARRRSRSLADARRQPEQQGAPHWGKAGTTYPRRAPANYADRRGKPVTGPSPRYVSNRIFSDTSQNLFSENGVTQWGAVWGQFLDHTFGLRQETGGERGAARL